MDRVLWLAGLFAGVFVITLAQDISRTSPLVFLDGEMPSPHSYSPQPKTERTLNRDNEWRLPRKVLPVRYNLTMKVNPNKETFSGSVGISFYCVNEINKVTLHAVNLNTSADLLTVYDVYNETEIFQGLLSPDEEHQTVTLSLDHELQKGHSYFVNIRFNGSYNDGLRGLYRSNYTLNGETKWLAVTHFEPTNARLMFPCFDEPNIKAYFNVTVIHPQEFTALSNTPLRSKQNVEDSKSKKTISSFEETVKMSTYLLAIVVSEYQNYSNENYRANIWARPDIIKGAEFSQRLAADALSRLENYTDIKFVMKKIDHVAVPHFAAGAMENYGLITYKEPYLSLEANRTNTPTKVYTVTVIAHELAHQWFGNLVTLDWWSYTWLNEAFATFIAYFLPGQEESWRLKEQFIPAKFQAGMEADQDQARSTAMTSPVEKPDEIPSKFDPISYSKGAAVLRMFENLLGESLFQEAVKNYLIKRASNNAKPEELFEEFQKVSNRSARKLPDGLDWVRFGESWTKQAGLPLVTITRDYATGEVTFSQRRLCYDESSDKCKQERWWVPIIWTFQGCKEPEKRDVIWISASQDSSVSIKFDMGMDKWILGNLKSIGYYRVNYDNENWRILSQHLRKSPLDIPTENRAQILHDALHLALANESFVSQALNVTLFLQNEEDVVVWMTGVKVLRKIYDVIGSTEAYDAFEGIAQKLLANIYAKNGITLQQKDGTDRALIQAYVTPYACMFGVPNCLKDARIFIEKILDGSGVHPDVETAVACGGVKSGEETLFWSVREKALESKNANINNVLLGALSCSKDDKRIKEHLTKAITEESLPKSKLFLVLELVIKSIHTFNTGFGFIRDNLNRISELLGADGVRRLLEVICAEVRTSNQYQNVNIMLESNKYNIQDVESLKDALKSRSNIVQRNKELAQKIAEWLSQETGKPVSPDEPDNGNSEEDSVSVKSIVIISLVSVFFALFIVLIVIFLWRRYKK